jgi:hypothetical protein
MVSRAYLSGDIPVLGPIGVAVTGISNTPVVAIGADSLRHGILFFNPNPGTVLRVLPAGATLVSGSGGIAIEPFSPFELYDSAGGNFGDDNGLVRVNCAWNVVADAAGSFGLTIWNFTDANPAVTTPPNPVAYLNQDIDISSPTTFQTSGLTTASSTLLSSNQNRRGILFHNPGTQNKAIAPANLAASLTAGSIILLPKSQKQINAFGKVRINCGFNALTANNSDGALTALQFV